MSREPDRKALMEPPCEDLFCPQTTQTGYLISQGGLQRPKLTLTRHDMLRFTIGFRVPSHGHLLQIIPIKGLNFTTFKEILQF